MTQAACMLLVKVLIEPPLFLYLLTASWIAHVRGSIFFLQTLWRINELIAFLPKTKTLFSIVVFIAMVNDRQKKDTQMTPTGVVFRGHQKDV